MSERELAAFAGPVHWHIAAVTHALVLQGTSRDSGEPLEVRFNEGRCDFGDARLADVTVHEAVDGSTTQWWLQAGARQFAVQASAVQVHIDARQRFFTAVPGKTQTLGNRAGWLALLSLLRLPGGARLIQWVRSR